MDVIDLTAELVAVDSQNPGVGEAEIARRVTEICGELGLPVRTFEASAGRPNLLLEVDAGPGPSLALCGHLDTKPIGDALAAWNTDPLTLTIDGDVAYGLGSSDMKGPVAAVLLAAARWARDPGARGRLVIVLTADEEAGSVWGAEALAAAGAVEADAMVIAEPSGLREPWEAIFLGSRGICCFELEIRGRQGHSGLSELLPPSATVAAARAIQALAELRPSHPQIPGYRAEPTVNAAVQLQGGVFFGVHPGTATVGCEVRTVDGMERDVLEAELREAVAAAIPLELEWELRFRDDRLGWMPPSKASPEHRVVEAAQRACEDVLGRRLPLAAYPGGTDATAFTQVAGLPCIASLGPGFITCAHGPNEFVPVEGLRQAVDLYGTLVCHYMDGSISAGDTDRGG
ncbi:MAG TPA: M20 family metallopeptidase [Capillimicrobium sp.]|nr:M20 family metallopeptidase [Capillimicrobium sp.]